MSAFWFSGIGPSSAGPWRGARHTPVFVTVQHRAAGTSRSTVEPPFPRILAGVVSLFRESIRLLFER
jgi:hypothetical protein